MIPDRRPSSAPTLSGFVAPTPEAVIRKLIVDARKERHSRFEKLALEPLRQTPEQA
jgi:hypothetical protein